MEIHAIRRHRQAGFTLLELMIVVVVVGILAAIALPSYTTYIMRSRIVDGTTALGDMRSQMEKYFMDNRTYQGAGGVCGIETYGGGAPNDPISVYNAGKDHFFTITCTAGTATTYTLDATGKGSMSGFEYTLDQTNAKTTVAVETGWGGTGATCWVTRKDGSC